ncbi:MAG: hypothetical protein ACQERN_02130 [Thermodesulfobacteriota bacterium]
MHNLSHLPKKGNPVIRFTPVTANFRAKTQRRKVFKPFLALPAALRENKKNNSTTRHLLETPANRKNKKMGQQGNCSPLPHRRYVVLAVCGVCGEPLYRQVFPVALAPDAKLRKHFPEFGHNFLKILDDDFLDYHKNLLFHTRSGIDGFAAAPVYRKQGAILNKP